MHAMNDKQQANSFEARNHQQIPPNFGFKQKKRKRALLSIHRRVQIPFGTSTHTHRFKQIKEKESVWKSDKQTRANIAYANTSIKQKQLRRERTRVDSLVGIEVWVKFIFNIWMVVKSSLVATVIHI